MVYLFVTRLAYFRRGVVLLVVYRRDCLKAHSEKRVRVK